MSMELLSSILLFLGLAAVLGVLKIGYNVIYNLWLSPLAQFPGPKLWAISAIPSQLSIVRGTIHFDITALHERYGPVVRIRPNELAFNTAQGFKDIYGFRPGGCFPKDRSRYMTPINGADHLVSAIDDGVHARHRKLLSYAFSNRALREQENVIRGFTDTMITKVRGEVHAGRPTVDMKNWLNYTTFDITGDLMFGESFNCLRDTKLHPWIAMIFDSMKALAIMGAAGQFPLLQPWLDKLIPAYLKKQEFDHFNLSAGKADRRLESGVSPRGDFMSAFIQNGFVEKQEQFYEGKKILRRDEIHSNSFILMLAGSETSATLLAGCIYFLCKSPETMQKLSDEIRSAFTSDSDITFDKAATLPYLGAVLEEAMRCYPPVAAFLARVVPPGGASVDGYFIPEKTIVACHHYASYHSSSNFSCPNDFIPERWLGDPRFESDKRDAMQAFSLGPRNCIGKNMAYAEMRMILCKLLYHFDMELTPETTDWTNQKVYFLWAKKPLMVTMKDRLSSDY
uniref:Trichothecene C-15 hydroxylase n=1 Tax=Coccidioides posadasii RMSCC 3488 TaxID=454284 RepID=A0A0J6FCA2_COCPO|nr:trichothecene C-15 hydroxylase [Coccidioides posadasii RMSCC 3488]